MAVELARAGLHTTAIADSAIFALMARVNKVGFQVSMLPINLVVAP